MAEPLFPGNLQLKQPVEEVALGGAKRRVGELLYNVFFTFVSYFQKEASMSRSWHKKAWQLQGLFAIPACVGLRSFLRRCDTSRALDLDISAR